MKRLRAFAVSDSGATAIENGMIAGPVSAVVIGTITALGSSLDAQFNSIASDLS